MMPRNKIFMNEIKPPKDSPERRLSNRLDILSGRGPLDGTNIGKKFEVTCWLCDGTSKEICQCHNGPIATECNMVCNPRGVKK
jgi:hypothetical protein